MWLIFFDSAVDYLLPFALSEINIKLVNMLLVPSGGLLHVEIKICK